MKFRIKDSVLNIVSSAIVAILNLVLLIFSSKLLGAEGRGVYTYFLTSIAFTQIFVAIVSYSIMVYMLNKIGERSVFVISFLWTFLISFIAASLIATFDTFFYNKTLFFFVFLFLQSIYFLLLNYLVYKINFKKLFYVKISQPLILFLIFFLVPTTSAYSLIQYVIISYLPFLIYYLIIFLNVIKSDKNNSSIYDDFLKYFKLGVLAQISNFFQFLNYRFSIWLLLKFSIIQDVGVFGLWLSLIDVLWLISTNIAQVNYANISKGNQTISLLKNSFLNFLLVIIVGGILYLIPLNIYQSILGKDFNALKELLIFSLLPVSFFSFTKIYASYFSAKGLIKYNTISSGIGFIVILISGFLLVPKYGLIGAVAANSISYVATTLTTLIVFYNHKKSTFLL